MSNNCPLNLIACTVQQRFSLWSVYTPFDALRRLRQRLIRSLRRVINKKCSPSANYTFPKDHVLSHHFHIGHNAPCLPPPPTPLPKNFAQPSSSISLGMTVIPRRNWKQWLCKTFGGKQDALWSMWKWWMGKLLQADQSHCIVTTTLCTPSSNSLPSPEQSSVLLFPGEYKLINSTVVAVSCYLTLLPLQNTGFRFSLPRTLVADRRSFFLSLTWARISSSLLVSL